MTPVRVRTTDPERDAGAVARIYGHAVETTPATFEEVAPSANEMFDRMRRVLLRHPWLVAESDGGVAGYAYATQLRQRAGYRWSVEVSAYVDPVWQRRGVGSRLYDALISVLRRQGMVNAYAGIALPNAGSVALHERIGMRRIGVYQGVGYKFGRWHDVAWYAMRLGEAPLRPAEPVPFPLLP